MLNYYQEVVKAFRKLYIELTGFNPFEYVTIAAACKTVYLTMIPENTIGLFNDRGNECYSESSIKWLRWISERDEINIQHALNGGEKYIPEIKTKVD